MPFDLHTVESLDLNAATVVPSGATSATTTNTDKMVVALAVGCAYVNGAAGAITTAVAIPNLPANYTVLATPSVAAMVSVTSKTQAGFNVVLTPATITATLAAGTFDVVVLA